MAPKAALWVSCRARRAAGRRATGGQWLRLGGASGQGRAAGGGRPKVGGAPVRARGQDRGRAARAGTLSAAADPAACRARYLVGLAGRRDSCSGGSGVTP